MSALASASEKKPTNRVYRVAVIPGDGIGKEVVPEGVRVLETAAQKFGFELRQDHFDFASCDYYEKHGRMMPEDWKEKIGRHDAVFFGAVGVNIWSLHAVRLPPDECDAALRDEALKLLAVPFKVLDAALAQTPYLLGREFTVADLNVAAVISRAVAMDLSAWPNLKAWLTRCLDRPAARTALALKTESDNETPVEITRRIARINRL